MLALISDVSFKPFLYFVSQFTMFFFGLPQMLYHSVRLKLRQIKFELQLINIPVT